jgi:hypothetical protein
MTHYNENVNGKGTVVTVFVAVVPCVSSALRNTTALDYVAHRGCAYSASPNAMAPGISSLALTTR